MKGLIDIGNTISEGCALDAEVHAKLGVGFKTRGGKPMGMAYKNGSKLVKEGLSNTIVMEINGFEFEIDPAVIQNISDPINIRSGLLETIGKSVPIRLIFNGKNTKLKVGNKTMELIKTMNKKEEETKTKEQNKSTTSNKNSQITTQLKAKENTVCTASSITFVKVDADRASKAGDDILVQPDTNETWETVGALYRWKKDKKQIAVLNYHNTDIYIKAGEKVGVATPAEVEKETADLPLEEMKDVSEEHRNKIIEDLQLHNNTLLKEVTEIKRKVIDLVKEFAYIFNEEGKNEDGSTSLIEFEVQLKEGATPVCQTLRPINPHQKASLKNKWTHVKEEKLYKRVIRRGRVRWSQLRNLEEIRGTFDGR